MDEVIRALLRNRLPFGPKVAEPQAIEKYPFFHDPKKCKTLWDVRKVRGRHRYKDCNIRSAPSSGAFPEVLRRLFLGACFYSCMPNEMPLQRILTRMCVSVCLCVSTQGLIPIVGGAREAGTSMLIEDVACPVDNLEGMILDLNDMFQVRVCVRACVCVYTCALATRRCDC